MIQTHRINIKGNIPSMMMDALLQKKYADLSFGYSYIDFTGTDEELNEFLKTLMKDESFVKVIGIE